MIADDELSKRTGEDVLVKFGCVPVPARVVGFDPEAEGRWEVGGTYFWRFGRLTMRVVVKFIDWFNGLATIEFEAASTVDAPSTERAVPLRDLKPIPENLELVK